MLLCEIKIFLFAEQFVEEGVEGGIFADDGFYDFAVRTNDDLGGEGIDTIVIEER